MAASFLMPFFEIAKNRSLIKLVVGRALILEEAVQLYTSGRTSSSEQVVHLKV